MSGARRGFSPAVRAPEPGATFDSAQPGRLHTDRPRRICHHHPCLPRSAIAQPAKPPSSWPEQRMDVLFRERQRALARALEKGVRQGLLAKLHPLNGGLHGIFGDQAINQYRLVLTAPVRPVHRLSFHRRVPPRIVDDHGAGRGHPSRRRSRPIRWFPGRHRSHLIRAHPVRHHAAAFRGLQGRPASADPALARSILPCRLIPAALPPRARGGP